MKVLLQIVLLTMKWLSFFWRICSGWYKYNLSHLSCASQGVGSVLFVLVTSLLLFSHCTRIALAVGSCFFSFLFLQFCGGGGVTSLFSTFAALVSYLLFFALVMKMMIHIYVLFFAVVFTCRYYCFFTTRKKEANPKGEKKKSRPIFFCFFSVCVCFEYFSDRHL